MPCIIMIVIIIKNHAMHGIEKFLGWAPHEYCGLNVSASDDVWLSCLFITTAWVYALYQSLLQSCSGRQLACIEHMGLFVVSW